MNKQPMQPYVVRLPAELKAKIDRNGGSQWLRRLIERARESGQRKS